MTEDRNSSPTAKRAAEPLLTRPEAAEFLRISPRTLQKWERTGDGPAFIRLGQVKAVRYARADLQAFAEQRRVSP